MAQLTNDNLIPYLVERDVVSPELACKAQVERLTGSNFAARVSSNNFSGLFVKQSDPVHRSSTGLRNESSFYLNVDNAAAQELSHSLPQMVAYFEDDDILVLKNCAETENLEQYHTRLGKFPLKVAREVADALASLHVQSFKNSSGFESLRQNLALSSTPVLSYRFTPERLALLPHDGRAFVRALQRYPTVTDALDDIMNSWTEACLVHRDFRFPNILRPLPSSPSGRHKLTVVDWERCSWGEPAWDVGSVLGEYLRCWLFSIRVIQGKNIETWFQNATIPLSRVRPAMDVFWKRYSEQATPILDECDDFLTKALKYAGTFLIDRCLVALKVDGYLSALTLCIMQIAKNLLTSTTFRMSMLKSTPETPR